MSKKRVTIEYFQTKNLIVQIIAAIVAGFFLVGAIVISVPDLINVFGPYELNAEQVKIDYPYTALMPGADITASGMLDGFVLMPKGVPGEKLPAQRDCLYQYKYAQQGKMVFRLPVDEVKETGIVYGAATTTNDAETEQVASHRYVLVKSGDMNVFAKVRYGLQVKPGDTMRGVFFLMTEDALRDIKNNFVKDVSVRNLFSFEFDTMYSMGFESWTAVLTVLIALALLTLILWRLVPKMISHKNGPLYKKIAFLNGDVEQVNEQLENYNKEGKKYITPDWVVTHYAHMTQISRNPYKPTGDIRFHQQPNKKGL